MIRYPFAEQVPWKYRDANGTPAYFKGMNTPIAAVLHISQGHASTARQWAAVGYSSASWHYTVCLDGHVMQHLDHSDGGYHAGIADTQAALHRPTWPLWKGPGINVNTYTIGIEHEGFSGDGFTDAQRDASVALCRWLSQELGFPYARDNFPPHADIDLVNRPSDFGPVAYREQHYAFMFGGDEVTREEYETLMLAVFSGAEEATLPREERLTNAIYRADQRAQGLASSVADQSASAITIVQDHVLNHAAGVTGPVAPHQHEIAATTIGVVK